MLYIHIPLCASKCHYCSFYSVGVRGGRTAELCDAFCNEIERRNSEISEPLKTIYFGGGTPSILPLDELRKIFSAINANFDTSKVTEITLEGNPDHFTDEYISSIKELGVNRISLGIQSFNDERLSSIGRKHTALQAIEAVKRAQRGGINNISIDLMFGFKDLSIEEWTKTIDTALSLGVQHISAYQLSIEEGTIFAKRGVTTATDEQCVEHYNLLCTKLKEAGFEHYEISNYAQPNFQSRHNSGYWTGEKYIGIGPSAHSYNGENIRSWNVNSISKYIAGATADKEILTPTDLHNEYLMTRLRTARGFSLSEYTSLFKMDLPKVPSLTIEGDRAYIAEQDFFTADNIISSLFKL